MPVDRRAGFGRSERDPERRCGLLNHGEGCSLAGYSGDQVEPTMKLKQFYEDRYSGDIETQCGWRELGAKHKAAHIAALVERPLPNTKIADVGGGTGEVAAALHQEYRWPEIDLFELSESAVRIAQAQPGIRSAIEYEGNSLPCPDQSYDLAFASHVVEHVDNIRAFLAELRRISKTVCVEVPIDHRRKIDAMSLMSYGHIHVFTPASIRFYMEQAGFTIKAERGFSMQRSLDMLAYNSFGSCGSQIPCSLERICFSTTRRARSNTVYSPASSAGPNGASTPPDRARTAEPHCTYTSIAIVLNVPAYASKATVSIVSTVLCSH